MANDASKAIQVELVAADRVVWSGQAGEVLARTVSGDLGILPGHAPLLSLLVAGVVEIRPLDGETVRAAVDEGFLSVSDNHVSILSEDAFLASEIDAAAVKADLDAARADDDDAAVRRAEAKLRLVDKTS
ncbi:F0F1 ATP synthase subunit epsilon [Aeromicrobium wangtongii]|uniref:ATP synthase epsilon chain n=1 Tax=Aeromicrobium wangtongii TaxID=2969247 RepID=A0ABY5M4N1_9ACTN|nr:F0F1 ATP synthase subunit epsilon [Aeromicrobium wangtongii]MCD9199185.1 F0F1 ATP synthase subunit epsilon [Aeromicrobium wangtongii]MCL3820120.1 F0F1 ATP synthase subunit epsilon [Aeromicrobium wangtongii]UUP12787.1 F0F1 ATP synthase subunit epsilon [Aeromicrobium wangtongii]